MAKRQTLKTIDVSNTPELLRLVQEMQSDHEPLLLRQDNQDVAILRPLKPATKRAPRVKVLTRDDSLFNLVGIGESAIPGGVSGKKHEQLLNGYRRNHA